MMKIFTGPQAAALRDLLAVRLQELSPRQRQFVLLVVLVSAGVGLLWLVFSSNEPRPAPTQRKQLAGPSGKVTNLGVMPPGQQVNAVDEWLGTAGNKLAQYESERDQQGRLNRERQAFEKSTLQRFAELEQRLTLSSAASAASGPIQPSQERGIAAPPRGGAPLAPVNGPVASLSSQGAPAGSGTFPSGLPPAAGLPLPSVRTPPALGMPAGLPGGPIGFGSASRADAAQLPTLSRVRVTDGAVDRPPGTGAYDSTLQHRHREVRMPAGLQTSSWLPVSFTRGTLLGGLDAPTGGQAQSNPHPVLIRLADNSVLPNRMRGDYRECFVIAAGYGDISSERAYLRTESLSCVRSDGTALEVRVQGSIYGEDGKVGMRGRLVTKQGQMLANALLAGVVSGIGQGLATTSTNVSTSALGSISSSTGSDAYRSGLGSGIGRALDRLAQYYIKLAENTFPVVEVDAGREIDVVITKGVRIDAQAAAAPDGLEGPTALSIATRSAHAPRTDSADAQEDTDATDY